MRTKQLKGAVGAAVGSVLMLAAPAFAAADATITTAGENVTAITTSVSGLSTTVATVVAALLGATLLAWGGRIAFKALRKGFQ